jgi:hypothetical protein
MSTAVLTAVAWAYRNGARHIGHKSGSGVASGVFPCCHRMAAAGLEIKGRCQHKIVADSGDGGFAGASGRVDSVSMRSTSACYSAVNPQPRLDLKSGLRPH